MSQPMDLSPEEAERLRRRLEEAEETIRAIRLGEVDAFVMQSAESDRVFALEEAEKPYRLFVERMQQAAATLRGDGTIFYCNRRFAEMLRRPIDELTDRPFQQFLDPSTLPAWDALRREAAELGASQGEIVLEAGDGTTVPVYAATAGSGLGSVALSLMLTDLTDQKRHEAIVMSESLSSSILDQAADAIVVCDETGMVIRASQGVAELCGRNPVRASFDAIFPPSAFPADQQVSVAEVLRGRVVRDGETRLRRADGTMQDLLFRAAPLRREGRTIGCVVTLTDISARKRVEASLREADRARTSSSPSWATSCAMPSVRSGTPPGFWRSWASSNPPRDRRVWSSSGRSPT